MSYGCSTSKYNLDLIWFDQNGNAVYMKENVPPCGNVVETVSCTYKTTKPALYIMAADCRFHRHAQHFYRFQDDNNLGLVLIRRPS